MKSSKFNIVSIVLTVLIAPVAQANTSMNIDVANNYFDANWALFNTDSQPYLPAAGELAGIASRYFDANGSLINNDGPSHPASTNKPMNHDMTQETGEGQ